MRIIPAPQPVGPGGKLFKDVVDDFVKNDFTNALGEPTLVYHQQSFYRYEKYWKYLDVEELASHIYKVLENSSYVPVPTQQNPNPVPVPWDPTTRTISEIISGLKNRLLVSPEYSTPLWLPDPKRDVSHLIPMRNGIFDKEWTVLTDHTPNLFKLGALPFNYDPDATCPFWDRWLDDILPETDQAMLYQQLANIFFDLRLRMYGNWFGPRGAGKSTTANVILAMLGHENHIALQMDDLQEDFGLEELVGKKLFFVDDAAQELGHGYARALSRLKTMTGGGKLSVNRKFKTKVPIHNPAVLILSNEMIRYPDKSGALADRLHPIFFGKTVPREQRRNQKELEARMIAEAPGIFNRIISEGLGSLAVDGIFYSTIAQEFREQNESDQNPFLAFFDEYCEFGPIDDREYCETTGRLHRAYSAWALENGHKAYSVTKIGTAMNEGSGYRMRPGKYQGQRVWYGVKLVKTPDNEWYHA